MDTSEERKKVTRSSGFAGEHGCAAEAGKVTSEERKKGRALKQKIPGSGGFLGIFLQKGKIQAMEGNIFKIRTATGHLFL